MKTLEDYIPSEAFAASTREPICHHPFKVLVISVSYAELLAMADDHIEAFIKAIGCWGHPDRDPIDTEAIFDGHLFGLATDLSQFRDEITSLKQFKEKDAQHTEEIYADYLEKSRMIFTSTGSKRIHAENTEFNISFEDDARDDMLASSFCFYAEDIDAVVPQEHTLDMLVPGFTQYFKSAAEFLDESNMPELMPTEYLTLLSFLNSRDASPELPVFGGPLGVKNFTNDEVFDGSPANTVHITSLHFIARMCSGNPIDLAYVLATLLGIPDHYLSRVGVLVEIVIQDARLRRSRQQPDPMDMLKQFIQGIS